MKYTITNIEKTTDTMTQPSLFTRRNFHVIYEAVLTLVIGEGNNGKN